MPTTVRLAWCAAKGGHSRGSQRPLCREVGRRGADPATCRTGKYGRRTHSLPTRQSTANIRRSACNLAGHWALQMLTHGGGSSNHGSGARRCGIRTPDQSGLYRPAPKRLHHPGGRVRASGSDDRLEQRRESRHLCGLTDVRIDTGLAPPPAPGRSSVTGRPLTSSRARFRPSRQASHRQPLLRRTVVRATRVPRRCFVSSVPAGALR